MKKPLMIVFEGPECAGKSTVASLIAEQCSCSIHKRVRTPDRYAMLSVVIHDIDEQMVRTSVGSGESLVLFDRWQLISDIIYEKYCYSQPSILEPLYLPLADACQRANILVIYMTLSEVEMAKRFNQRGDRLRTFDEAIMVRNAYEKFFSEGELGGILPFVKVDVTGLKVEETLEKVLEIINEKVGNC